MVGDTAGTGWNEDLESTPKDLCSAGGKGLFRDTTHIFRSVIGKERPGQCGGWIRRGRMTKIAISLD